MEPVTEGDKMIQCVPMISKLIGKLCPGLDHALLLGECMVVALDAIRWHDRLEVQWVSWLTCVNNRVSMRLRTIRKNRRYRAMFSRQEMKLTEYQPPERKDSNSMLGELFLDLSKEAIKVVKLALEVGTRSGLKKILQEEWGWTKAEIETVFEEVRRAL